MMDRLNYKDLPEEMYVLGSVENGEIDMESEDDINGNQWICAWSHKDDCEEFKKEFDYQRPVSLIPKKYLTSILYNANVDNKHPVIISYLYFNPSISNISSRRLIKDTDDRKVIDVASNCDYLIEVEKEQDRRISEINQKMEDLCDSSNEDYTEISERFEKCVASIQKDLATTKELRNTTVELMDTSTKVLNPFNERTFLITPNDTSNSTINVKKNSGLLAKFSYFLLYVFICFFTIMILVCFGMTSFMTIPISIMVAFLVRASVVINKKGREYEVEQQNIELESQKNKQVKLVENITKKHISTLAVKQKQLTRFDDYGNEDASAWDKELYYFIDNVVYADPSVDANIVGRFEIYGIIHGKIFSYHLEAEVDSDFIENMTGYEYEIFCENILDQDGWNCKLTKSSGDQGVDIIAKKENVTLAIQCKKYASPVGNKAVQEVYSGKKFYGADYAIVVSSSTYTQSAKQLANNLNVILAHHDDLTDIEM